MWKVLIIQIVILIFFGVVPLVAIGYLYYLIIKLIKKKLK
jgi:hypothetical protein